MVVQACVSRVRFSRLREASLTVLAMGIAATLASPALADQSPATAGASGTGDGLAISEIVVTAQKRSENMQRVPIAISAVTAGALESKGVKTTDDLNVVVPGLTVSRTTATGVVFIRGVGTNSVNPGVEPPIAYYVDGVYSPSAVSDIASFNNIERVEVLKGPQGTLFGRNSTGGLINVITRKPSFDGVVGSAKIGYGNFNTFDGNAYVSGPLSQNLAADFSVYGTNQGKGWGRNRVTGANVNFRDEFGVRSKWQLNVGDQTTITLSGDYAEISSDLGNVANQLPGLPVPPAAFNGQVFNGSIYDTATNIRGVDRVVNYGGYFRVEHDFDNFRVTNTAAFRRTNRDTVQDLDQTSAAVQYAVYSPDITTSITDELQIASSAESRIQWIAGLYYFHANAGAKPLTIYAAALGAAQYQQINDTIVTNSYAAFAQTTFPLVTDATKVTLGIRYTHDYKHVDGTIDTALARLVTTSSKKDWPSVTYRAAIQQQLSPNALLYASVSSGFKSGTYNATTPQAAPVNPEKLTAYEGGIKSELLDRRLRFNLAGFYYKYKDLQLTRFVGTTSVLTNAAAAEVYGFELEGQANIATNLSLTYGAAYLHGKYTSFPNSVSFRTSPTTGVGVSTNIDATGNQLQRTPRFTFNAGFDYVIPSSVGEFGVNGNFYYNDGYYFDTDNQYAQKAYSLTNLELRWTSSDEKNIVRVSAKNIFDVGYYSLIRTGSGIPPYGAPGAPRTYGVSFTRRL